VGWEQQLVGVYVFSQILIFIRMTVCGWLGMLVGLMWMLVKRVGPLFRADLLLDSKLVVDSLGAGSSNTPKGTVDKPTAQPNWPLFFTAQLFDY